MNNRISNKRMFVRTSIVVTLFLIILSASQLLSANDNVMTVGEELEYEVSFLGVKLGKIIIITEGVDSKNGKQSFKTKSLIDSYNGIPFLDLHAIYESWIDQTVSYSTGFLGKIKFRSNSWEHSKISFDYTKNLTLIERWNQTGTTHKILIKSNRKYNDGLSLFFLARQYTNMKRTVAIPTIMDLDTVSATINFKGSHEKVEIDAVGYPIRTIYLDGKADFTGLYGMSGRFEGWFSDDDARIPILAKMNVYLGSVRIELVKWKRKSWSPPRAD